MDSHAEISVERAPDNTSATQKERDTLIEKNIKWSELIYDQNKKIQRRLTFLVIGNYVRLLLIFIPIIIAVLYLLPFAGQEMESYASFQFFRDSLGGQGWIERLIDLFPERQ